MRTLYNDGLSVETPAGNHTIYIITNALTMDLKTRACNFDYEKELNWLLKYILKDEACLKKIMYIAGK